jgi:DNA-binding MarR family transcriptional regulator
LAASEKGLALLDTIRTRRDAYLASRLQDFSDEERRILEQVVPLLERLASGPETADS